MTGQIQTRWNVYLKERSEEAFKQVVAHHVDLIYGTALRTVAAPPGLATQVASISLLTAASQTGWLTLLSQINHYFIASKAGYLLTETATVMVALHLAYQFREILASSREFREVETVFLSGLAD